jgi:hypothetical protein
MIEVRAAVIGTGSGRAAPAFRTIGELATRCGHYCWLEHQLFALTGTRASVPASPDAVVCDSEIRVFFSEMAAGHAFLAGQWRDRLPVRAGIDPAALVVPPPGSVNAALHLLGAERDSLVVLGGLVEQILPRLLAAYEDDAAHASAVSEAPVRALLEVALLRLTQEIRDGRILLRKGSEGDPGSGKVADFGAVLQQALRGGIGIVPAAWAS